MKHWRRSCTDVGGTPGVTVVSVTDNGDGSALWEFSAEVISATTTDGLQINGNESPGVEAIAGNIIELAYTDSFAPGDPWVCDPAAGLDLVFDGGGAIQPGSGIVL